MSKLRVNDRAGEFGITSEEEMDLLRKMDVPVRSHLSPLTDDQVARVRVRWEREKRHRQEKPAAAPARRRRAPAAEAAAAPAPAEAATSGSGVRRRRRVATPEVEEAPPVEEEIAVAAAPEVVENELVQHQRRRPDLHP